MFHFKILFVDQSFLLKKGPKNSAFVKNRISKKSEMVHSVFRTTKVTNLIIFVHFLFLHHRRFLSQISLLLYNQIFVAGVVYNAELNDVFYLPLRHHMI